MRRCLVLSMLLCAGLSALPAAAEARHAHAIVKLASCDRATNSAIFHPRMRRVRGTYRMWMRMTMLERRGRSRWRRVRAPGLDRWRKSRVGVRRFGWRQRVKGLSEGSAYRMSVGFRWVRGDGRVVKRARVRSRLCRQYEALPNLRVRLAGAEWTSMPGVLRYVVRVRNAGEAPVAGARVRVSVDGAEADTRELRTLRPGAVRTVGFHGPACRASVVVLADPDDLVRESNEWDNTHSSGCPSPR